MSKDSKKPTDITPIEKYTELLVQLQGIKQEYSRLTTYTHKKVIYNFMCVLDDDSLSLVTSVLNEKYEEITSLAALPKKVIVAYGKFVERVIEFEKKNKIPENTQSIEAFIQETDHDIKEFLDGFSLNKP